MSENRIEGAADDPQTQAAGKLDEAKGKLQDAYGQGQQKLQSALDDINAYTRSQPWLALGAALATGLLIGHVSGRSKRKVVYVQRVKPSEVR